MFREQQQNVLILECADLLYAKNSSQSMPKLVHIAQGDLLAVFYVW